MMTGPLASSTHPLLQCRQSSEFWIPLISPGLRIAFRIGGDDFLHYPEPTLSEECLVIFESSASNLIPHFQELHWHQRLLQVAIY